MAAQYFSSLDSSIIKILNISKGTYYIGKQDDGSAGIYWMSGHNVLSFSNVRNLTIQGEVDAQNNPTTILKLNPCMKYGAFDPTSGERHLGFVYVQSQPDPVLLAATVLSGNFNICATVGDMIYLNYCNRISIRNLELDGNISETVIGGGYTEGIQLGSYSGITMNSARNVTIDNVSIHHFGYDGLTVRDSYCPGNPFVDLNAVGLNLRMNKCNLSYNARNNMTWAGGYKVTATNCRFDYAGQARFYSKPGAGLDIEYEPFLQGAYGYPNSNGAFYNCSFEYNIKYGMINDVHSTPAFPNFPPTRNIYFNNCTFIGDYYSMQNSGKQVVFDNCTFVGSVSSHYGELTSFANSRRRNDQTVYRNSRFLEFWNVPGVGMRSFQQTPDDNLSCPPGHGYLLSVQGPRTEFFNSYIVTNYSMRGAYMTLDVNFGNQPWWNKFQFNNMNFYSYGLNECSCENGADISVFENVNLSTTAGQSAQWFRNTFYRNSAPGCIGLAYNSQFNIQSSSSWDLVSAQQNIPAAIFQTSRFLPPPDYPVYSKFVQSYLPDRLDWVDLFSYDVLNPSYDTYTGVSTMCIDPPERKSLYQKEIIESEELSIFPNTSQDFTTIRCKVGSKIYIKNSLGETINLVRLESNKFTLRTDKMICGLYLVSDDNGNVVKLIIAR